MTYFKTLQTHQKLHGPFQVCLCLKQRDGECNLLFPCYIFLLLYLIDMRGLILSTLQSDRDRVSQSRGFSGTFFLTILNGLLPFFY